MARSADSDPNCRLGISVRHSILFVLDSKTFVPIQELRKRKGDPLYDNRLTRMLNGIGTESRLEDRELSELYWIALRPLLNRQPVDRHLKLLWKLYRVNEGLTNPVPYYIALVDDVFKSRHAFIRAAKSVLSSRIEAS